jgi:hypothetical protein
VLSAKSIRIVVVLNQNHTGTVARIERVDFPSGLI